MRHHWFNPKVQWIERIQSVTVFLSYRNALETLLRVSVFTISQKYFQCPHNATSTRIEFWKSEIRNMQVNGKQAACNTWCVSIVYYLCDTANQILCLASQWQSACLHIFHWFKNIDSIQWFQFSKLVLPPLYWEFKLKWWWIIDCGLCPKGEILFPLDRQVLNIPSVIVAPDKIWNFNTLIDR